MVVANLDRRRDRWLVVWGFLTGQRTPPAHIERVSAYDGSYYGHVNRIVAMYADRRKLNAHYGNGNFILKNFEGWDAPRYAAMLTWYDIMDSIACELDNVPPRLVLLDDAAPVDNYPTLSETVRKLHMLDEPFRAFQLVSHGENANEPSAVSGVAKGFVPKEDFGVFVSPLGARRLVEFADENPTLYPATLFSEFAKGEEKGFYSSTYAAVRSIPFGAYSSVQDGNAKL